MGEARRSWHRGALWGRTGESKGRGTDVQPRCAKPCTAPHVPYKSYLLDVFYERRHSAVAIEEDRQAIGVVKAECHEVPRGVTQAGIAEVEEYRPPALGTTEEHVIGLQVAVYERQARLLA